MSAAASAAARFALPGPVARVEPHPGGHIHRSFVVTAGGARYLLQRVNTRVFTAPERVMENIAAVTSHLGRQGVPTLTIIPALDGNALVHEDGGVWRMFAFIEGVATREMARTSIEAGIAARAFGEFARALADYAGPPLHETIPGFHDTARYFAALDEAAAADALERRADAAPELAAASDRRARLGSLLADARMRGVAPVRPVHNDAKISNLLFNAASGAPRCIVDLDTVMPGLALSDFGDLVRSMVSSAAEDEPDASRVHADPDRYRAIVEGYLEALGDSLTSEERALLPDAAQAIVLEQGVRFLADFLEGDRYYAVAHPRQNLERARVQLALLRSLEEQRETFQRLVAR